MISFIEKNYFKINLLFLFIISFYCMAGLLVPLQFISSNKFVTLGMTLIGVLLGLSNFFVKKAYLAVRKIEYFNQYKELSCLFHLLLYNLSGISIFHSKKSSCPIRFVFLCHHSC